jgi:hypothetical protein
MKCYNRVTHSHFLLGHGQGSVGEERYRAGKDTHPGIKTLNEGFGHEMNLINGHVGMSGQRRDKHDCLHQAVPLHYVSSVLRKLEQNASFGRTDHIARSMSFPHRSS